ncbi:MAG: DUF2491 family protein [Rhodopila sp.]|nr:DUF2491 family protein [Rhodopila sp.]
MLAVFLAAAQVAVPVAALLVLDAAYSSAVARSWGRVSGGYSLSRSFSSRTPSFGGFGGLRTPSVSGGYSRPSSSAARPGFTEPGAGDTVFSRERSATALGDLRAGEGASRTGSGWGYGGVGRTVAPQWFASRGWSAPSYAITAPGRFGIWDGLFLWFLLDHLSQPGYGAFFYNHQSNPGYQQWRAQADQVAANDPQVRQNLHALDQKVAEQQGQPRDPNYLPPDVPAEVATANGSGSGGGSSGTVWLVVLGGVGALTVLAWRRRVPLAEAASMAAVARRSARGGRTMTGPLSKLIEAGTMLRHKVSGEGYAPELFRVGMALTCDPTPFILAAGATKVPSPMAGGDNAPLTVQAVGHAGEGSAQLIRLYLPEPGRMFQLHLDATGQPDECRYFGQIDEVAPADAEEWRAWLDPAEGMIGWPEFQTKDGKLYQRIWAPGATRIAPRALVETIETPEGMRTVRSQSMLYAAPTGVVPPGPPTEYILVAAIENGNQAWVAIAAGIDINPAALSPA